MANGLLPNITYLSCPLCKGTRKSGADGEPCTSCEDPDLARVRWMLPRLTVAQIDFLRAFEHTLADQPVTKAEYDAHGCELFVDDEQTGEQDYDGNWVFEPQRHWFASGMAHSGPCGNCTFIRYTPTALMLREALICGATALIPHMYPARHDQAVEQRNIDT